jgi:LuxR family maltose regulon positive regulatory protein
MEGEDMTIQPGSRTDTKAPHRVAEPRPVTRGKFAPPRFPDDLVGIERWQSWLDAIARHEICFVRAPAGYGKTAFAAALFAQARSIGWYAGWVSFDPDDNDSGAIGHLFEAVRLARGAPAEDSVSALCAAPASAATLASALAERIEACDQPVLLVLDNIDRVAEPRMVDVLDRLLRHPPPQLRLVLVGRNASAIRLDDIEGRGMLLRFGRAEIGLTNEDICAFLRTAGSGLDARGCEKLHGLLLGWPIGLRMAVQKLDRLEKGDWSALTAQIDAYLLPLWNERHDGIWRFLGRASVAPLLNDELVRLLGEGDRGISILEDLHAQGMFVERSDDGNGWYYVHPAVRAVFRTFLDQHEPERAVELHRVAGRYYEARGLVAHAIDQFLSAGADADAARLVGLTALSALARGDVEQLAAWLDALPREQVSENAALIRARAWIAVLTAEPDAPAAIAELRAADEAGEAQVIGVLHTALVQDLPETVVEEGDQFLAAPERLSGFAVDMMRAFLACGAQNRGLFGLVHDVVRPLRPCAAATAKALPTALATRARAAAARAQGQMAEAERVLRDGRRLPGQPGLAGALIDAALARSRYERDDLSGAANLAASALPWLEPSCFQDALIEAFQICIRAAAATAKVDDAATLIDRAEQIAFERNWMPLKAMCVVERTRLRLPPTIDAEAVLAAADEDAAVLDPLSAQGRAFALLCEMRAYEAIAHGDRPRLTTVAERLLRLASNADDAELRATATLLNILPQLSGRCDKMVELETVRFLNHAASAGFHRTIVDILDVTGVRAVQNFCSEAYSSGSFLALLKLAEPSRRNPALEGSTSAAPGEAFSFLTEREIEILSALNAGESNKEIARTLQLAPETVKWHLKNVMRKLRANSREEAVQNASTLGLTLIEIAPRN